MMGGYTELVADDVTDEIVPPSYFPKKKKKWRKTDDQQTQKNDVYLHGPYFRFYPCTSIPAAGQNNQTMMTQPPQEEKRWYASPSYRWGDPSPRNEKKRQDPTERRWIVAHIFASLAIHLKEKWLRYPEKMLFTSTRKKRKKVGGINRKSAERESLKKKARGAR